VVTDAEVAEAMRYAFAVLKLVVEPGGAVGLAALLAGKTPAAGGALGVVLSGGNVDPALFARVIQDAEGSATSWR
jgi:threonine dehydratase